MRYKCLILDHDDTVVNSTATIHYPSFIEYLKFAKPELVECYTLESFIDKNFNPGIFSLLKDEVGLTDEQMEEEQGFWEDFVNNKYPTAYQGLAEILHRFKESGGIIAVASHSMQRFIERDYENNRLPVPDVIYGWDLPREKRKPFPYAVFDVMERFGLSRNEILMVDDLKPGYDMARAAGIDFAAAGWGYDAPQIESFMRNHSDFYLKTVSELSELVFD